MDIVCLAMCNVIHLNKANRDFVIYKECVLYCIKCSTSATGITFIEYSKKKEKNKQMSVA